MRFYAPLFAAVLLAVPANGKEQHVQAQPTMLTGIGYAPISPQPAATEEGRRLLAIRATQLAAMRNLAEQLYGLKLQGASSMAGSTVRSDSIRASVTGTVAGATIVKITPKGDDTYETVVELQQPQRDARR